MRQIFLPVLLLTCSTPAAAQVSGEVIVFSGRDYTGEQMPIYGVNENLRLPFQVRSLRVAPNARWQLCMGVRFALCQTYAGNHPNVRLVIGSARPVAEYVPGYSGGPPPRPQPGYAPPPPDPGYAPPPPTYP